MSVRVLGAQDYAHAQAPNTSADDHFIVALSERLHTLRPRLCLQYPAGTAPHGAGFDSIYICIYIYFFFHTSTFQLMDKPSSQVSSLLPPGSCLQFLSRIGFSNPTARRLSSSVANSRSRVSRKSICAQGKVPTNLYEYALGGIRTHESDLYQARG